MQTKTNFFTTIEALLSRGLTLTITVRKDGDNLVVATRPARPDVEKLDDTMKVIQPLVLTYPAADLDENFFETITSPLSKVDDLADAVAEFEKGLKSTESKTKMAKKKGGKSQAKAKSKPVVGKKAATKAKKALAAGTATQDEEGNITKAPVEKKPSKADVIKAANEEAKAHFDRGVQLTSDGFPSRALEELAACKKLRPSFPGIGKAVEAATKADQLSKVDPMIVEMNAKMTSLNFAEAVKVYKQILVLDSKNEACASFYKEMKVKFGAGFTDNLIKSTKI